MEGTNSLGKKRKKTGSATRGCSASSGELGPAHPRDPGAIPLPRPRSCTGPSPRTPPAEPSALSHCGRRVWLNRFAEDTGSFISPSLRCVLVWAPSAA